MKVIFLLVIDLIGVFKVTLQAVIVSKFQELYFAVSPSVQRKSESPVYLSPQ